MWQSLLKADQWHRWFPQGFRIVAGCKIYPASRRKDRRYSWDPIIFWGTRTRLRDQLPLDWHVADCSGNDDCGPSGNPHPCPRPLSQVLHICQAVRANSVCDPFMGSGTTGVACIRAGKRFIGIERDPQYFAFACQRIARAYHSISTK